MRVTTKSIAVLGAGLVGICTAIAMRERGFAVDVIDRDLPGQGASMGNAGVVSPWACIPQSMPGLYKKVPGWLLDPDGPVALRWAYAPRLIPWLRKFLAAGAADRLPAIADAMLALNKPNLGLYRQLLRGTGHESQILDSIYIYTSQNPADMNLNSLAWRIRAQRDVHFEYIDGNALREREPAIAADYPGAIIIHGQGRAVNPGRLGEVLAEKAAGMGVQFHRSEIRAIKPGAGNRWQIETGSQPVSADIATLTAGVWSARLLSQLGIHAPLEAERGYHQVFTDPGVRLNNSVHDIGSKIVASSMQMGIRCAGTAEFAGIDAPADYRRARSFSTIARRLLPALNTTPVTEWMGRRPSTPDSVPYLGKVANHPGLLVGFGHGHLGLTGAPHTGQLLATLAAGEQPTIDMTPYRLDRFS